MTMVMYLYKSQWLVAYILFLMQNRKKIAGKQHIQKQWSLKYIINYRKKQLQVPLLIKIYKSHQ